jgi:proteasome activator subunit 4
MNRNELPEMIASMEPLNAGFCLTDINDPRHQYMIYLRHNYGQFLHKASVSLRQQGEENTVDAVHMLVSGALVHFKTRDNTMSIKIKAVRTYMLEYGDSRDR